MSRLFGRRRLTFSIYLIMNMKLTHLLFTLIAFLVMTSGKAQKASADIPYRFATRAEAQMLITDIDAYTNGWNQFDLNVRLQTQNGRKSQLLKLAMESTLNWSDADKAKLNKAFAKIETAIKKQNLKLPVPSEVILMKTSMAEEGGATAYTRENWIAVGEKALEKATEEDFGREFQDYKMAVKTTASLADAIEHITCYGSGHSESIITEDKQRATQFCREVDAACVYVNAPTSFTDGGQFGLGAEIGISTQKLHARGPMGLEEITTYKWVIEGNGQTRP